MDAITNAYDSDVRAAPEAASPPRLALGLDPGIKHFRRIATRFEKTAGNFLAAIKLASVRIWLRRNDATAWRKTGNKKLPRKRLRI